jgi:glucose-6-phosphate 1-dehydrogenase
MPPKFRVVGYARRPKQDAQWRTELRADVARFSRNSGVDDGSWRSFEENITYCQGDLTDAADYRNLAQHLAAFPDDLVRHNVLFYLATSPSQFAAVGEQLQSAGLLDRKRAGGWRRIVVEKPFGHDLESAIRLNRELTRFVREDQIFRIDHYLGKETVQNILTFRFSNSLFERLWNRDSVDHVLITVGETKGVGRRAGYYEEAGALRDMVQNHLLQVLSLVAMEPPVSLEAEAIRDEKVKLLKSVRLFETGDVGRRVVRGQYSAAVVNGVSLPGYRQEPNVRPDSNVETFVAVNLLIDNWRWSGVPFYMRTGKCLPANVSEVRVQFRRNPHVLFAAQCGQRLDANSLALRLQPDEGIALLFNGKVPGVGMELRPVRMDFRYDSEFGAYTPEAYERLLAEAMVGDATLFIRSDEVEAAWKIVDPIRAEWNDRPLTPRELYPVGTWGPAAAEDLLNQAGHRWREPQR